MDKFDIVMCVVVVVLFVAAIATPILWYHHIEKPAKQKHIDEATHICFYTSRGFAENETTECFPVDQITYSKDFYGNTTACIGVKCSSSYYFVK